VLLVSTAGSRVFDADMDDNEDDGGGDGTGMGGNVQCRGKESDVFAAEENPSDSICKICSFVNIGFPKVNWFSFVYRRSLLSSFLL
jgi:hypothetical protein